MLARRRDVNSAGTRIFETPLLVPSFSSRGFEDVDKIVDTMREFVTESILVSAYDIHHGDVKTDCRFPELVILDSGGYEWSRRSDLSDVRYANYRPKHEWSKELYQRTLDDWAATPHTPPTITVSYDEPGPRLSLDEQIGQAHDLLDGRGGMIRELLVKPETEDQQYVQYKEVIRRAELLGGFDVVGFTEKELGNSALQRMERIALIRRAMDAAGVGCPIHVLGGLDPISTPLYYMAGAEIFDGLSWLRFAYYEGLTIYKSNFGVLRLGIDALDHNAETQCWVNNTYVLNNLKLQMRSFQASGGDFTKFKFNQELLMQAYDALRGKLGEEV